jgi:hypothetical protein
MCIIRVFYMDVDIRDYFRNQMMFASKNFGCTVLDKETCRGTTKLIVIINSGNEAAGYKRN